MTIDDTNDPANSPNENYDSTSPNIDPDNRHIDVAPYPSTQPELSQEPDNSAFIAVEHYNKRHKTVPKQTDSIPPNDAHLPDSIMDTATPKLTIKWEFEHDTETNIRRKHLQLLSTLVDTSNPDTVLYDNHGTAITVTAAAEISSDSQLSMKKCGSI